MIKLNGEERRYDTANPTILELLALEKVQMPEYVSVQINGTFAQSKDYGISRIAENDE